MMAGSFEEYEFKTKPQYAAITCPRLLLCYVRSSHGAAPDMEDSVAGFKTNCKSCRRIATIARKAWEWLGAIHDVNDVNDVNDEWWWREGVTGYFEGKERPDNAFQRKQRGRIAEAGEFKYLFTVRSCKMQGFTLILASQIWRDRGVQKDGRDVCAHVTYMYIWFTILEDNVAVKNQCMKPWNHSQYSGCSKRTMNALFTSCMGSN